MRVTLLASRTQRGSSLLVVLVLALALPATAPAGDPGISPPALRLSLPGRAWVLEMPGAEFAIEADQARPDGRARALTAQDAAGVVMTVFLEAGQGSTSQACRDQYWQRLKSRSTVTMDDVKMSERGPVALVEYVVREVQQVGVDQKHLNAYLAKDDTCVDIHLSKVRFTPADEARLVAIATSARIRDARSAGPASMTSARAYIVPKGGALQLTAPDGWRVSFPRSAGGPPIITFFPPAGKDPQVLITASPASTGVASNGLDLRRAAEASGTKALGQSVERALALRVLRGPQAFGYFYTLTDRAPKPDGHKYMTRAHLAVGGLAVKVTILFSKPDVAAQKIVFEMLRGATHRPLPVRP